MPYDYDALESTIDVETMKLHHDKHHQAYVDNANKALDGTEWADASVEEVLRSLDQLPERQASAGPQQRRRPREPLAVLGNHGPAGGRLPAGELASAIDSTFGGFDSFKEPFNQPA